MIAFFPNIYEDELLYSAIARYHIRSANISLKASIKELFNSNTVSSVVELPSHIDDFIKNLPINSKYSAEEIILNHTMFPLYTAFLPRDRSELLKKSMKGNKGESVYNIAGLMASSITSNRFLKFCPRCFEEDKKKFGEAYWHRIHQVPGIYVCAKHQIPTQNSNVFLRSKNKHEFICATEGNCFFNDKGEVNNEIVASNLLMSKVEKVISSRDLLKKYCKLAKNVELLLSGKYERRPYSWFWKKYNNRLIECGFANVNGRVDQKKLIREFKAYYGEELLSVLQSNIREDNYNNWLSQIVRKPRKSFHPIRHLLVIEFLNMSIDEVFNGSIQNKPFGEGPWPCLNAASNHYLQPVIDNITITYDHKSKKTIGTFKCNCGFVYSRSGPDSNENDKYKFSRIKNFGEVWEGKLKELVAKKLSLREIARRLKADPKTIDKYAKKLNLERYWKKKIKNGEIKKEVGKNEKHNKNLMIDKYRKEWNELAEKNPDKNKTELRKLNGRLYAWLYRNDKEWITKYRTYNHKKRIIKNRIDWKKRDIEILEEVINVVDNLLSIKGKPIRITTSKIGKEIGKLSLLEKHLDKLPLTKEYLDTHTESVKDFQQRRIKWAINELEKEGEEIKEWKVMKKAGINKNNIDSG